jgi:hypothetical protein
MGTPSNKAPMRALREEPMTAARAMSPVGVEIQVKAEARLVARAIAPPLAESVKEDQATTQVAQLVEVL